MAAFTTPASGDGGWVPHVNFNPITGSGQGFNEVVEEFYQWRRTQTAKPLEELGVKTGWCTITPEIAEQLLIRNQKNRKTDFSTMRNYAVSIVGMRWKRTGQTILIGKSGRLLDGAHRLWGAYLTGTPIEVYVIDDIDDVEEPLMFAYIDQIRKRSGGDALATAGHNGLSNRVSTIIVQFAKADDEGKLTLDGVPRGWFMSNVDVLDYEDQHTELAQAVHMMDHSYKDVGKLLGHEVAGYLGWRIAENHGYNVMNEFMRAMLADENSLADGHPIRGLRTVMELHERGRKAGTDTRAGLAKRQNILSRPQILAHAVTAFNLSMRGQLVRKLTVPVQGEFPQVVTREELEAEQPRGFGSAEDEAAE